MHIKTIHQNIVGNFLRPYKKKKRNHPKKKKENKENEKNLIQLYHDKTQGKCTGNLPTKKTGKFSSSSVLCNSKPRIELIKTTD